MGAPLKLGEMRPRGFRVDEIRRERRNSAPIVDSGREQHFIVRRGEVGRSLDIHVSEHKPRDRHRPQHLAARRLRPLCHGDRRLRAEVLHDHLLDVTVAMVQFTDSEQSVHPIVRVLADADQQPGGERYPLLASLHDRLQAPCRYFVGCPIMRCSRTQQGAAGCLQHQAKTRTHCSQPTYPLRAHQAGIGMRQERSLTQHQFAHRFQIMQSRLVSQLAQRRAHFRKHQLRLIAQAEQSLATPQLLPRPGYIQHFLGRHGMRARIGGIAAESAVAAVIAAQVGERQKDFARIRDRVWTEALFCRTGRTQQLRQFFISRAHEPAGQLALDRHPVAQFIPQRSQIERLIH